MELLYAKNADFFYDNSRGGIIIAKRGANYYIKGERSDLLIMKDIVSTFETPKAVEDMIEKISATIRKKYLGFIKFLWERNILVSPLPKQSGLSEDIKNLIIGNYDASKELFEYWQDITLVFKGLSRIRKQFEHLGIKTEKYLKDQVEDNKVYIGFFSEKEYKEICNKASKVVLFREKNGSRYFLIKEDYDSQAYKLFNTFDWETKSEFFATEKIIPIQLFLLISNNLIDKKNYDLYCIAGDGSVQNFRTEGIIEQTASYFDRRQIKETTSKEVCMEIEKLHETVPWLVSGINRDVEDNEQSPVYRCEVEIGTGQNKRVSFFCHEDYEKALEGAFIRGIEGYLKAQTSETWIAGRDYDEYCAKGYMSLIELGDSIYKVKNPDKKAMELIQYIHTLTGRKIEVFFVPSEVDEVGRVLVSDNEGKIYQSRMAYDCNDALTEVLYEYINGIADKAIVNKSISLLGDKNSCEEEIETFPEALTSAQAVELFAKKFMEKGTIIDEKIWSCQYLLTKAGIHVGRFVVIR